MHLSNPRAGRWPLALTLVAVVALAACAEDPVAPKIPAAARPAMAGAPTGEFKFLTVTNTSGGTDSGSIRWAADRIQQAGGVIRFAPALDGATITLLGPISADGPMYIEGLAKGITLSGNYLYRVILGPSENGLVSLTNVTVTKGYSPDYASAIRATSVYLSNSTVHDNRGPGSAIRVRYGFSATNSTISSNLVSGPAVEYSQYAYATITNSTIAFNSGPGIGLHGPVDSGYQLLVVLNNSILSNNGNAQNCLSTSGLRYEGRNISSDWSCGAVGIGIGNPQLMPLANNGGPTKTHAISYTSPAYNTGSSCFPTVDQRYVARDAKCDIGAFEFNDFTQIAITLDANTKVSTLTGKAIVTGTIKCTRNDTFMLSVELHQDQKKDGQIVDIHSVSHIPVNCTTTVRPWSATMTLLPGETWVRGAARVMTQTFQTPEWATPANKDGAVTISLARK